MKNKMYWNGNGKYQRLNDKLHKLIPNEGSVSSPKQNPALEKLRKATNCYYDLFNNGLCNRATEFRNVFGFGGTWIAKQGYPYCAKLETIMDEIILNASHEQNIK